MRKKLLMAIALLVSGVGNLWADDVFKEVTGKITNPSFEDAGATTVDIQSGDITTGWTYTSQNNGRVSIFNSSSSVETYGSTSPSADKYFMRIRGAGGGSDGTQSVSQKNTFSLTKSKYRILFDYKAARANNTEKKFTISAKNGSNVLGSKQNTISQVSANSSHFAGIEWTTDYFDFTLTATTNVTLNISCETSKASSGHTILLLDNFILEWNLTQSLSDLKAEANTFYTDNGSSDATLYAVIVATDPTSTDADDLESQYETLSDALDLARAKNNWKTAYDTLDDLDEDALPTAAKSAITSALGATEPTTTDDYNTATETLQGLIDSYDGILAAYVKVNALITLATNEKTYSAGDADAKSTLNTAISTATTNKETRTNSTELNSDYTTLESARQTYVVSGAEPYEDHPFDWTFKLSNSSFESGTTGWTLNRSTSGDWTYEAESYTPAPVDGVRCLNAWGAQINYIEVYQNVTLPRGSYSFKGYLYSTGKKEQHIYAYITSDNPSSNLSESGSWEQLTADFTQSLSSDKSVKLGIYSAGNNKSGDSYGWFRADKFQLFYNGSKPVLDDVIADATTLSTINVGTEAFQFDATTLTDAIGVAQAVSDEADAVKSDVNTAISDLNTAIDNFKASELKSPNEATPYNLYLSDGGTYAKNLTFKDGNPTAGTYAIGFTEDSGSAFNQAVHFKGTGTKNQYKIYIEDAAGTKYYICTGTVYGGSNDQIRVTTTEGSALAVLLEASNEEDGVYYLKNTASSNKLIGTSDGGFYTTTKYNKFNINAAAQCEVPVAITSGKWGTRIFPFEVTSIPDGLEAYTITGTSGDAIVKSNALTTISANTPVLLKASKDVDTSVSGYGVAKTNSYTEGLLTGVYTTDKIAASVEPTASDPGAYRYVLQTPTSGENEGKQAFYKVTSAFTATAYRCYLSVDIPATGEGVKAFYLDGDETAVSSVKADELQGATIYNLAGQRVSKAQKGVYIINGKKVAVK